MLYLPRIILHSLGGCIYYNLQLCLLWIYEVTFIVVIFEDTQSYDLLECFI